MLSANQVVLAGGWRTIELDSEFFDDDNEFNTTTHTFTASRTGRYLVGCVVMLNPIGDQKWSALRIWLNGTTKVIEHYVYMSIVGTGTCCLFAFGVLELTSGDSFVLQTYHNGGGTVNALGGWGGSRTCLTILRLSEE